MFRNGKQSGMEISLTDSYSVSLALFDNVSNAEDLKHLIMNKTIDAALIKPSMILDQFQVLAASYKALHQHLQNEKKCRTLHSELLYCLSPSKNISESFRRIGISDEDTTLLVAEIHLKGESKMRDIEPLIDGNVLELSRLSELSDASTITQLFKIKEEELSVGSLLEAVVARNACKDFVTF